MSVITKKRCDICSHDEEGSYPGVNWGVLTDVNEQRYDVCSECLTHIFERPRKATPAA